MNPLSLSGRVIAALCTLAIISVSLAQPPIEPEPEAWEPGRLISAEHTGRLSAQQVQAQATQLFGGWGQPIIENDVDRYLITLATTGHGGEVVQVKAQMFVPVDRPHGESPLFVYGSGTTGVGHACAPSRESLLAQPLGRYAELLAAYAGRGFVTVIPDYLGFDLPGMPQAYFHAESEAHVLLDAARAVREFFTTSGRLAELADSVFFGGYSQGGHAAFAVADSHAAYAPEVPLEGVLSFAGTNDVQALLGEAAYYAPYVALSYASVYGDSVNPAEIFAERWLSTLSSVAAVSCIDRVQVYYPVAGGGFFTDAFERGLRSGDLHSVAPGFAAALDANHAGLSGHATPALIVQGGRDVVISDPVQERFVASLCEAGSSVRYVNYPTARHRDTRPAGFERSILWMRALLPLGAIAEDDCGEFGG